MKKAASRFIVLLSVLAILIVNLAVPVSAADLSAAQIRNQITTIYQKCYNSKGSSFSGYCGAYVGWQLYHMGINSSYVSMNGNVTFDYYNNSATTSGGYTVTSYPASRYTLKSALNALSNNGTKNVYNILVGLEKGNTASAQTYGHAVFIHAIIGGMVYFSESSNLTFGGTTYSEGSPICLSIDQVCDSVWMYTYQGNVPQFDGIIHFQGGSSTPAPNQLTISGINYPITKASGGYFTIWGTVSSPSPLVLAEAIVYDMNNNIVFCGALSQSGAYYFDFNSVDSQMSFSTLPNGTYRYFVQAKDTNNYYACYETTFTVGGSETTSGSVDKIVGIHYCSIAGTWGTGVVKTEPTCMSTGVRVYTCSVCNATKEETIPKKTTHTYGEWKTVTPATINAAGESRRYCTVNGCTAYESKVLPQLEHTHDFTGREEIVTPASCTAEGSKKVYCTNSECGEYTLVTLPKTGHTAGEWQVDGNKKVKKCTECGKVLDTVVIDENAPTITVETKRARAGKTVLVDVILANNEGIWGADLTVEYDKTKLTLVSVTNGTVFADSEWTKGNLSGEKYILSYEANGLENITANGVIATLEFTVNESASAGDFLDITVSYKSGDIINTAFEEIDPVVVSGGVKVINVIYGDVNGDGEVNKKDSLLLKMYLADNSVEIDKEASDVFHDGEVNKKDSLYLKQYLAGLDVELGA